MCTFVHESLDIFVDVNTFLQRSEPLVHVIRRSLVELFTDIAVRFLKPAAISGCEDITKVSLERKSQKHREDIMLGSRTRQLLDTLRKKDSWERCHEDSFFHAVRSFFVAGMQYLVEKIPVSDPLFKHAEVADVQLRATSKFSDVRYFIQRFPQLLVLSSPGDQHESATKLEKQFLKFQVDASLPEEACRPGARADIAWASIAAVRDQFGAPKYDILAHVMLGILTIPHSNAFSERIFSAMKLTRTDVRNKMNQKILSAALVTKQAMTAKDTKCYQLTFTPEMLKVAKSAATVKR